MKSQNLPLSLSLSHAGTLEIDSTAPYRSIGLLDTEMGALSYTRERQTACCGEGEVFTRQGIVHVTVRQTNAKNAQCSVLSPSKMSPLQLAAYALALQPTPRPFAVNQCSLVTWNLLAPHFAPPEKYPWSNPAELAWPARQDKIIERLAELDADVICLQEVEVKLWPELLTRLSKLGYDGELQKMSSGHPIANAVLVHHGRLQVVRTESRSRVLITVLRDPTRERAPPLYLANCHLEAGGTEKAAATRLYQLRSLLRRLDLQCAMDVANELGRPNALAPGIDGQDAALVLAGDFNFDRSSELHAFLRGSENREAAEVERRSTAGDGAKGRAPARGTAGQKQQRRAAKPSTHGLLPLRDAYLESPPPWGPPLRATYRNGRLLDFVFVSRTVEVLRTMPMCELASSPQPKQVPSATMPSDHLPIGAVLTWAGAPPPAASTATRPAWQQLAVENVQQQRPPYKQPRPAAAGTLT